MSKKITLNRIIDRCMDLINQERDSPFVNSFLTSALISIGFSILSCVVLFTSWIASFTFLLLFGSVATEEVSDLSGFFVSLFSVGQYILLSLLACVQSIAIYWPFKNYIREQQVPIKQQIKQTLSNTFSAKGLKLAISYTLFMPITMIGFCFFIIPGVILFIIQTIALIYAIDNEVSYLDALKPTKELLKDNYITVGIALFGSSIIITIVSALSFGLAFGLAPTLLGVVTTIIYTELNSNYNFMPETNPETIQE